MRVSRAGSCALRRMCDELRGGPGVRGGRVHRGDVMSDRTGGLQRRVRGHGDQRRELRRVRSRVRCRADVRRRRVPLRCGAHGVRRRVREHVHGCVELRRVRARLFRRRQHVLGGCLFSRVRHAGGTVLHRFDVHGVGHDLRRRAVRGLRRAGSALLPDGYCMREPFVLQRRAVLGGADARRGEHRGAGVHRLRHRARDEPVDRAWAAGRSRREARRAYQLHRGHGLHYQRRVLHPGHRRDVGRLALEPGDHGLRAQRVRSLAVVHHRRRPAVCDGDLDVLQLDVRHRLHVFVGECVLSRRPARDGPRKLPVSVVRYGRTFTQRSSAPDPAGSVARRS